MRSLRPNFPFSVIPGGAYSRQEFLDWSRRDPVVRRHYEGFNGAAVRLVSAREDMNAYVSYRKNDAVFWTKRKLRIPKGELLITDGLHLARARCGNRVSETIPPSEMVENSPDPTELSLPGFTMAQFQSGKVPSAPAPEFAAPIVFPILPLSWSAFTPPPPVSAGSPEAMPAISFPFGSAAGARVRTLNPYTGLSGVQPSNPNSQPGAPPVFSAQVPEPGSVGVAGLLILMAGLGLRRFRTTNPIYLNRH